MSKITKILDPNFKSGVSDKTKKPWVLCKIEVDDKIEATIFAPVAEGDEVELKFNDQYKNYSATKVTARSQEQAEVRAMLIEINQKLDKLLGNVRNTAEEFGAEPLQDDEELPF